MTTKTATKAPFLRSATRLEYDPSDWDGEFDGVEVRFWEVIVDTGREIVDRYEFETFDAARAALTAISGSLTAGREVFPCSWMVERTDGYEVDFPSDVYVECGAPSFEDADGLGWHCFAGHGHRSDLEYFDDEEIAGARNAGRPLPANAATMAGARLS